MAVNLVTDEQFSPMLEGNSTLIVKYFADWCGTCKLIAPKFKRLSDDTRFTGITFVEINAEENEVARKAAGVDNLPFFATFREGKLVKGSATSKEENIVKLLEELQ